MRFVGALVVSSAVLCAQAQDDRPQFRAGVELIQLDVVVLDGKRQPVAGLTEADFTVLDEGKPTPIRAFTPVQLAARTRATEAVWATEVAPDVTTNAIADKDGRLVIILFDRSIRPQEETAIAKKIATTIVQSMGPNDVGALVSTMNNAVQDASIQNLTADRSRLLRTIAFASPAIGFSSIMEAIAGKPNPLTDGQCACGVCVPETIQRVAEAVRDVPRRRKVMFFIGSEMMWQPAPQQIRARTPVIRACELPMKDARTAMLAAVDRANLTVHSIDPAALTNTGAYAQAGIPGGGLDGVSPELYGPNVRGDQLRSLTSTRMAARESLALLPDRTGGRVIVGTNNPEQAVPAIFHESDSYYVLGIERTPSTRPDATRSIEVKVAKKGLRVMSQRLYGPSPGAIEPVTALLPSGSLPLSLAVLPFVSPGHTKPFVLVNVDAGAFTRTEGTGTPLQIVVQAVDRTGRPVASARQTSTITTARLAGAPAPEVNVQSHLELEPGDYGIRVVVTDPATGNVSSVFADTTVPDFDDAPLVLSGVNVERTRLGMSTPTTSRAFGPNDDVRAVLQIHQGVRRTDPIVSVSMRVQILDAKGVAIVSEALPFAESAFTNRRADCVVTLPLAKLPAGEYVLKLEASTARNTSGRALRFVVQ